MRNRDILEALQATGDLLRLPLAFGVKLKLRRMARSLQQAVDDIAAEQKTLFAQFAVIEGGSKPAFTDKGQPKLTAEYWPANAALLDADSELSAPQIRASEFGLKLGDIDERVGIAILQLGDLFVDDLSSL